jgi:hypothetical protein
LAYSVDWVTRIVTIPQADLTFVATDDYELNVVTFWSTIHDIQDSGVGIIHDRIMTANAPTPFGPRGVQIVNGYQIEFEDGAYTVTLTNANSDIIANHVLNQVSIQAQTLTGATPDEIVAAIIAAGIPGLLPIQDAMLHDLHAQHLG